MFFVWFCYVSRLFNKTYARSALFNNIYVVYVFSDNVQHCARMHICVCDAVCVGVSGHVRVDTCVHLCVCVNAVTVCQR